MKNKKLKAIDLFSGCGGLSLGLKKSGFDVIAAVEIDSLAAETYAQNHKNTKLIEQDIRKINPTKLMKELGLKKGDLDLIAGCPPCQGFSTLRTNRKTVAVQDYRNNLMFNFLDFVRAFLPKAIMMENVPGLAKGRRIAKFVSELKSMGYEVKFDVLNVAHYGVAQRRKRFILVAGHKRPIEFAKPAKKMITVGDALKGLESPLKSFDPAHNHGEKRNEKIREMISYIPLDGGSRTSLPKRLQMKCHQKTKGFLDVFGRIKWNDVGPTITGGCINPTKGRFLHPFENRTITVREAALIQSFPKSYYFSMRKGKHGAALMVGNALPPEFIRRHAKVIKDSILGEK